MKIIEILQKRSSACKDKVKIDLKLYNLADDLEKSSRAHLKRVLTVLPEFDIHDEKHSEKVVENIEKLLGTEVLNSLSSYELFLLHLSSFLHDCAMAPSDWEINTMKLTEGYLEFNENKKSINHDLKTPFKFSSALSLIKERKKELYNKFDSDIAKWIFSPKSEDELINYLAKLLINYQDYRNGFAKELKKVETEEKFKELNHFIRIDFIRATHHIRIEKYVRNLELKFSQAFEQPAWGKKLAHDLAKICRSHGEDSSFINSFSTNSQYYGSESANLQFVAIMLRLGDIIHFSYDRAPIDLRTSRIFKSAYSFLQWAIKSDGVNYTIDKGRISFRAYCETPETFFKLHDYLDWIELEIQNYFIFQRQWKKSYIKNLHDEIDRSNITNDKERFFPIRGLSFSLNQKKILELLTGVGLYKDKYACIRELYQNSLDACKCMLSINDSGSLKTKGLITFNIENIENITYLTCIDNGIGMTKEVIENYLLKIGNSFYKSSKFYKLQANWGGDFTPTSQFGIGILSCFMIGNKIEITSKVNGGDYISCTIDGPHEHFYYTHPTELEKEQIPLSGTIVRISIPPEILNNKPIEKLGLQLLGIQENRLPEEFDNYKKYTKNWDNHIFNKINQFIQVIPEDIEVKVLFSDNSNIEVLSKPIIIDSSNSSLGIKKDDFELIDYLNKYGRFYPIKQKYSEIKEFLENYRISVCTDNIEFITTLTLPKKSFSFDITDTLYATPKVGTTGTCIDGINVGRNNSINLSDYYSSELNRIGIINFVGEIRPQLSVDRTSLTNYPAQCEKEAEDLSLKLLKEILKVANEHISKYNFEENSKEIQLIWEYIFEKIGFTDTLFINELSQTKYGEIQWERLNNILEDNLSIREFLAAKKITISNYDLSKKDVLSKKLILTKLISSNKIIVNTNSVELEMNELVKNNLVERRHSFSDRDLLILADDWQIFNSEFDIVSNLYPIVPKKLFDLVDKRHVQKINDRIIIVHSFSNGIMAFFNQNPVLINNELGLYLEESSSFGRKINHIYNFDKKRSKISLFELNDRFLGTKDKERIVLQAYISPLELSEDEADLLKKYETKDPNYVNGVKHGWSLLATSMDIDNIVIKPGKSTRSELISLISNTFWEEYHDYTFKFTDNSIMLPVK